MSAYNVKYHDMCLLGQNPNPGDYFFIAQGVLTVAGMDDKEEMQATDEAFDVLGFTQEQKDGLYMATISICFLGNAKWKQKGREEQAEPDGMVEVTKAAKLMGVDADFFVDTFMKPKLKVGKDFVKKGQNKDQVAFAVSATSKSLYARMFDWVVLLVNDSLDTPNPRKQFIGVLDIAGFEIFELNTLEQLLINYTNERLQQFFNHHMFVQEQEEYKQEGIQWAFIDFGMDLLATIELIEKKMGILSMLEEECIVPKATDKTYLEKLMGKHLGKNDKFGKPKPAKKGKPEAHFELGHYAGVVGYNVTGWLFKNKDPVNEAVIAMMQEATNIVVNIVFQEKDTGEKKKGSAMMTISAAHRESLMKLMTTCTRLILTSCVASSPTRSRSLDTLTLLSSCTSLTATACWRVFVFVCWVCPTRCPTLTSCRVTPSSLPRPSLTWPAMPRAAPPRLSSKSVSTPTSSVADTPRSCSARVVCPSCRRTSSPPSRGTSESTTTCADGPGTSSTPWSRERWARSWPRWPRRPARRPWLRAWPRSRPCWPAASPSARLSRPSTETSPPRRPVSPPPSRAWAPLPSLTWMPSRSLRSWPMRLRRSSMLCSRRAPRRSPISKLS